MVIAVPLLVLVAATAIAAFLPRTAGAAPTTARLLGVEAHTRTWRWIGLVLGLGAAAAVVSVGALGRGVLLAAPVFAVCVLAGVIIGELRVTAPTGETRRVTLEVRRVRDFVPRRLGTAVGGALALLVVILSVTTAAGVADDMGRAGRTLARQCSANMSEFTGPWPGSFYSVPLAVIVVGGLLVAAFALHRVVRRPRQGEEAAADDGLRRSAAEAVTAATGLLVAIPLAGVCFFAGGAMLGISCRPVWWTAAGVALLVLTPVLLVLAAWCGALLVAPARR